MSQQSRNTPARSRANRPIRFTARSTPKGGVKAVAVPRSRRSRPSRMAPSSNQSLPKSANIQFDRSIGPKTGLNMSSIAAMGSEVGKMSRKYAKIAREMVLPIDATGAPELIPAKNPRFMCARNIRKEVDISQATNGANITISMEPDLFLPAFISNALSTANFPVTAQNFGGTGNLVQPSGAAAPALGDQKFFDTASDAAVIAVQNITDSAAVVWPGYNCVTTGTALLPVYWTWTFKNKSNTANAIPTVTVWNKVTGGPWVLVGTTKGLTEGSSDSVLYTDVTGTMTSWGYLIAGSSGKEITFLTTTACTSNGGGYIVPTGGQPLFSGFPSFILDEKISSGRVTAMSVLVVNTSSALVKGGNVAGARVPFNFNSFDPSGLPTAMSGLPSNRQYQGSAEYGFYAFWVPGELDELEPDTIAKMRANYRTSDRLMVNLSGLQPGATFKVIFNFIVNFYTQNQVFEKRLTPPSTQEWDRVLHSIQAIPSCSCNPEHESIFREYLRKASAAGSSMYKHYDKNRAVYDGLMAILAGLV